MKKKITILLVATSSFLLGLILVVPTFKLLIKSRLFNPLVPGRIKNGPWITRKDLGSKNAPQFNKTYIAFTGLGANISSEAIYWEAFTDEKNQRLIGNHSYAVHFFNEPPIQKSGFWSLIVYNEDGFMIPNDQKKYSIGDRTPIIRDKDNSFTIHISPKYDDNLHNWLPAPLNKPFSITLRMFVPTEESLLNLNTLSLPQITCEDCLNP